MSSLLRQFFALLALALLSTPSLLSSVQGDRCIIPIVDVDVYGPGQKATVAWNGDVEHLILSTDLYTSDEAKVLEVLPLPSKPKVEIGSFESFDSIQRIMMKNVPKGTEPSRAIEGLRVVFHEKIGAHDVTVVEASSLEELERYIFEYLKSSGLKEATSKIGKDTEKIVEDYLERGYGFWVFDLIDLYSSPRSIEPIIYEFQSSSLYYPLEVSATAKGHTEIILYLITPEPIGEDAIPSKMRLASYLPSNKTIRLQLSNDDLAAIDKGISTLFGPRPLTATPSTSPAAWFTAVKYEGDLSDLDFDLEIQTRPSPCRSIRVSADKAQYDLGEIVRLTVDFAHLLPGCFEVEVLHSHHIRLEVFDSSGSPIQSWRWMKDSDLNQEVMWKPEQPGLYTIRVSSWWDGERLEVEDRTWVAVTEETATPPNPPAISPEIRWLLYGVAIPATCILIGVGVAYLLLKPRLKSEARKHQD
jgi:hypothetical protein